MGIRTPTTDKIGHSPGTFLQWKITPSPRKFPLNNPPSDVYPTSPQKELSSNIFLVKNPLPWASLPMGDSFLFRPLILCTLQCTVTCIYCYRLTERFTSLTVYRLSDLTSHGAIYIVSLFIYSTKLHNSAAFIWSLYVLWSAINGYFNNEPPSERFQAIFDFVAPQRHVTVGE